MKSGIVHSDGAVLLVGGGACTDSVLKHAVSAAETVVAADSGAARVLALGRMPDAVIGDMDSLDPASVTRLAPGVLHVIAEQDSTDFDKCLRNIRAPLVLGYGFLGARLDHQLAAMTVLARRSERRCVLVGEEAVVVLCPPRIVLPLEPGCRVSLYPLGPVLGRSDGLRWPIGGLAMTPDGVVGTSNAALGAVTLEVDAPCMLLILPVACLNGLLSALEGCATWPAPA